MVSSFEIIVLDSKKSKEINLYSDYTEHKLKCLILQLQYFCSAELGFGLNAHHWKVHHM